MNSEAPDRSRVDEREQAAAIQADFFRDIGGGRQFPQLFDHLDDVYFFIKDARSRLMGASPSILRRFDLQHETEIVGATDFDFFPRHIAAKFVADDQLVIRTGKPLIHRVEIWYTPDRLLDWFVTNKLPIFAAAGDRVVGVMGTIRSYEGGRRSLQPFAEISEIVDFIRDNLRQKVTVKQLADRAGVSTRQLHRRFQEVFGISAQSFLNRSRIQAASDSLLNSNASIASIAHEFCFCDQSAFTQQFKKQMGVTPLQFRKQNQA